MNERLETFKKYFLLYQKEFGLMEYRTYFECVPLDGLANITLNQEDMTATVRLNNEEDDDDDIKQSAKHEALHLLLSRLEHRATLRSLSLNELDEIIEGLVHKLEVLIPDKEE